MKLKILHIVIDDKFIDGAISLFETDDRVENTYAIIGGNEPYKYIKYGNIVKVELDKVLDMISQFDVVVIHSLPAIPLKMIEKIPNHIKVVWYAWGYDIYEKPYDIVPVNLLGIETRRHTKLLRLKRFFDWRYQRGVLNVLRHLKKALSRIDYFSGVFPYEIDMVKAAHPEFRAIPLDFYYGSKDFFIPETPTTEIRHGKKNIIIGNSANPTGNHLDVLKTISNNVIEDDVKIIIPLSYGGMPQYLETVKRTAEKIAPGNVCSLTSYVPFNEYINLISNCRVAIFAHERQQASDNIFLQMIYGARVYMSETSAAFYYLKSIGLKVYSLQSELHLFNVEMSDEDVMCNRKVLSARYSSSKLRDRIIAINTTLIKALEKNT